MRSVVIGYFYYVEHTCYIAKISLSMAIFKMSTSTTTICFVLTYLFASVTSHLQCLPRDYGHGSIVCVCNSQYCDTVEENMRLPLGKVAIYQSSQSGDRLSKRVETTNKYVWKNMASVKARLANKSVTISINKSRKFQTIIGFGGAFTDSAGINIAKLPSLAQNKLLESYFSNSGIKYSIGRIPMASCDFSTRVYSYDDVENDFNLEHFKLANEDMLYKIPNIRKAIQLSGETFKLFASPWSAPGWLKTSGTMYGNGTLKGVAGDKYHKTWAKYFIKFLEAYKMQNISIWGITVQNEPSTGFMYNYSFQTMGFTPQMEGRFVGKDLGPLLASSIFNGTKIMIFDDQRLLLFTDWVTQALSNSEASKYVSGIAVHWYTDFFVPDKILNEVHEKHPDKFILGTEACVGSKPYYFQSVVLGSWKRAEDYIKSIMGDLQNWVTGWVQWNLALDLEGGPNWVKNFVDASIIVNKTDGSFLKQPTFYIMGHFSKFLLPGTVRIGVNLDVTDLVDVLAFSMIDNSTVVIVTNTNSFDVELLFESVGNAQDQFKYTAFSHSIQTYIWWNN